MTNLSKRLSGNRFLALLTCALLLLGALGCPASMAEAEDVGSLRITLRADTFARLPENTAVAFTLYQIGVAAPETRAGWAINDDLSEYGILEARTSGELGEIAAQLADGVRERYRGATQLLVNGETVFDGLPLGVYLGVMTQGPDGLEAAPFIVTVPARNPETQQLRYDYDVVVKDEYVTPSPRPVVTPTPILTATPGPTPTATNTPRVNATPTPTATNTPTPTPPRYANPTPTPGPTPVPTTQVTGMKLWEDDGNAHNTRPARITVRLYADGTLVNATPRWRGLKSNRWSYTFSGLPAVNASGASIRYTVREVPVDGYESSVSGTTITNTLIPRTPNEYRELTGRKTWSDNEKSIQAAQSAPQRPNYITVRLLRNGEVIATRTVTAANDWSYSFGRQPVDDGYGNTYSYEVREDAVKGYFCRVDGLNLINTALNRPVPNAPGNPDLPDSPYTPTGWPDIPTRRTGTPPPRYDRLTEEDLSDLIDLFDYGTPLWGGLLGTGDETPAYPYIFAGIGAVAVIALVVLGVARRKKRSAGR